MAENDGKKIVASNRKARHDYEILETWEAGMVLKGPEVKSLRAGTVSFADSFASLRGGEMWIHNLHISPYEQANRFNEDPLRVRKLLLAKSELRKLIGKVEEKGLTLVPLDLHFRGGFAKLTIGLGRGRKLHDKREKLKERDQEREARRAMGER
jgi:SsrA-binding protein